MALYPILLKFGGITVDTHIYKQEFIIYSSKRTIYYELLL